MKARFMWLVTNVHGDSWTQSRKPLNSRHTVTRVLVFS